MKELTGAIMTAMMHPGLMMIGIGLFVMLLPRPLRRITGIIAPAAALWALMKISEASVLAYDISSFIHLELIHYDSGSFTLAFGFCIIAFIYGIYGESIQTRSESGLSLICAGSAVGTVLAGDCISLMLFLGIMVLSSSYIIYTGRAGVSAPASLRQMILHVLAVNLIYAGLIIYMFHYGNWIDSLLPCYGEASFWLVLAGIAVICGILPFQSWLADAWESSSSAGSACLAAFSSSAAVSIMIRMFSGYGPLIWIGAAASVYAVIMALTQNDIRRLLAYAYAGQIGMITAVIGIGGEAGINAAVSHVFSTMIIMSIMLMCAGTVVFATGRSGMTELGGLAKRMPVTGACFAIASLAAAGIPVVQGSASLTMIIETLRNGGYDKPLLLVLAGCAGTILAVTLRFNYYVLFGRCEDRERSRISGKVPITMTIATAAGAVLILFAGLLPDSVISAMPAVPAAFSAEGVWRFIAMLAGASVPFFLFIGKTRPRDGLILDVDWFVRRPLRSMAVTVSYGLNSLFTWFDDIADLRGKKQKQ